LVFFVVLVIEYHNGQVLLKRNTFLMPLMVFFVSAARTGKLPSCSHATSDGKKNLPAVLDGAKNSSVLPWKTIGTQEPTWKIG